MEQYDLNAAHNFELAIQESQRSIKPGDTIDGFTIEEELHAGGMAIGEICAEIARICCPPYVWLIASQWLANRFTLI